MTAFDYAVLLILGLSVLLGMARGLIREVIALAAWAVAFWAAQAYTPRLAGWLPRSVTDQQLRHFIAFALLFVLALLLCSVLSLWLSKVVQGVGLGGLDHLLGIAFGAMRGLFIVVVLVLAAGMTALPHQPFWQKAMLSTPLEAVAVHLKAWLPADLAKRIHYE